MSKRFALVVCVALAGCKSTAQKEHEEQLQGRPEVVRQARAAADKHAWSAALDALDDAATVAPLSAGETQLHELWEFRKLLDMYCAGKVDDLLSATVPDRAPSGLDAATLAKANQLLGRRQMIQRLRELRDKQGELSEQANSAPGADDSAAQQCKEDIEAFAKTSLLRFQILSDLGGGTYEIEDSNGATATLTTVTTRFTTRGWAEMRVSISRNPDEPNGGNGLPLALVEVPDATVEHVQECQQQLQVLARSKSVADQAASQLHSEEAQAAASFVSECAAADQAPRPLMPQPAPGPPPVPAKAPADAALPPQMAPADVEKLVDAQAASLTSTAEEFVDSFSESAIAFFPHTLQPYEGHDKISEGPLDAWGRDGAPSKVETSPVTVGIAGSIAWATTTWKITLGDGRTVADVRVTELIRQDPSGISVVAAHFSTPAAAGDVGAAGPVPTFVAAVPPGDGPEHWLAAPPDLATHVRDDFSVSLFGSDANEQAVGADSVRKLLAGWRNVKLEIVGNVRVIDTANYKVVLEFVRWRRSKGPVLYRVLGVFVPATGGAWELAAAHYSVAAPGNAPPATTAATGSACTVAALDCKQFSSPRRSGRKLHELVFAAEQAGRHAEALCLAQPNMNSTDKWLAGAANFEASRAWEALGCHDAAVAAIETSLAVRPRDQAGWKETCEQCKKIGGTCSACSEPAGDQTVAPVAPQPTAGSNGSGDSSRGTGSGSQGSGAAPAAAGDNTINPFDD